MGYTKTNGSKIGKQVVLTERKMSLAGFFEKGSIVTITGVDHQRGYSFTDSEGNQAVDAGWGGFRDADNESAV